MRNVIANSLLSHTHNTPCLSPKVLHEHCFQFLLRLLVRELEKNTYANFVLGGGGGETAFWSKIINIILLPLYETKKTKHCVLFLRQHRPQMSAAFTSLKFYKRLDVF